MNSKVHHLHFHHRVGIVPVNISYDVNENKSSDSPSNDKNMDTEAPINGRSYLVMLYIHKRKKKMIKLLKIKKMYIALFAVI